MEAERLNRWKLAAQDPRLRVYGGNIYRSIHWIPADMVNQQPEIAEENDQEWCGETQGIHSLPDDVIRQVFDKMPEARTLCICSLVSKKLALMVLETKAVSLEIQSWGPVCSCHQDPTIRRWPVSSLLLELFNFLTKPVKLVWWLLRYPFRKPECLYPDVILTKPPAIKNFLNKFSSIESLTIDLSFSGIMKSPRFEPLVRWKCDKSGLIFLSAKTLDLFSDDDGEALGDVQNVVGWTRVEAMGELISTHYHFMDAVWRLVFIVSILEDFPSLKNVLVTDCMNQGRIILDEDEIVRIRDSPSPLEHEISGCVKVWHMPVVKLPLSGLVVKEATLCMYKEVGVDDDLLVQNNAFEENEYCELARTMLRKAPFQQLNISASEVDGRFRFVIG